MHSTRNVTKTRCSNKPKHEIVLSVVVCGDRVQETLVMIKSALSLSQDSKLRLIILAEEKLVQDFIEKVFICNYILEDVY